MKKLLIAASVLTCLSSSAAFAQVPTDPQSQQSQQSLQPQQDQSSTPPASTLTRAQVEHELAVAEQDGELHYLNTEIYQGS